MSKLQEKSVVLHKLHTTNQKKASYHIEAWISHCLTKKSKDIKHSVDFKINIDEMFYK
jgi:hypothetical protein